MATQPGVPRPGNGVSWAKPEGPQQEEAWQVEGTEERWEG